MKVMIVEMPDGSEWQVPVDVIARNRAEHYANEFDGDVERSLAEDTMPLFASDDYEVKDWAENNMNWADVVSDATQREPGNVDYQDGWANGEKRICEA